MTKLSAYRQAKKRFARSINLERDSDSDALSGYLPVGRALESVERLALALSDASGETALSITGPYGSGKSSLALLIDALFSHRESEQFRTASSLLEASAPAIRARVDAARQTCGAEPSGFIRAVVTAQRESVSKTVLRALLKGAESYFGLVGHTADSLAILGRISTDVHEAIATGTMPDTRGVRTHLRDLAQFAPVLLVIDEFGKNLEAFAETPGEGDLFLLQELAEWTRRTDGHRVALVTLQHMAFGDYADVASGVQRREWVKIQGRFEDIPFVDTPEQTRALVAAAFESSPPRFTKRLAAWAEEEAQALTNHGLADLADSPENLAACWPLHPLSVAVLPDLCQRYGQNERTMFSFLASNEPRSVTRFLLETDDDKQHLPVVGLDRVYDYFVESASAMVGVSADASRWLEIDTRIRDTQGLTDIQTKVLKTVGLLNLVSTGGSLRASYSMLGYAAGLRDEDQRGGASLELDLAIRSLEEAGVLTYRDFADEYRVWQGSDVDLKGSLERARRRVRDEGSEEVLRKVLPLGPIVASRHSHVTGTFRVFERIWLAQNGEVPVPLGGRDRADGLVAYVVGGSDAPTATASAGETVKPFVFVTSADSEALVTAARELLAIDDVLSTDDAARSDWVTRRELAERRVSASAGLKAEFEHAFGAENSTYHWAARVGTSKSYVWRSEQAPSASVVASDVADQAFPGAIPFKNELINRHELTSQAARARREVVELMLSKQRTDRLGMTGNGPEVTLYLSLLKKFGFHGVSGTGEFEFRGPKRGSGATRVWNALLHELRSAVTERLNVEDLFEVLGLPPFGLRPGVAPVLLAAALIAHSDEFALYEHGTFRPRLNGDVCERLLRNPGNFELKYFAAGAGVRGALVRSLDSALESVYSPERTVSLVTVVGRLVAQMNGLSQYARRTGNLSQQASDVRRVLATATEPDDLLFAEIPRALGWMELPPDAPEDGLDVTGLAEQIAAAFEELRAAQPQLLAWIKATLQEHLKAPAEDMQPSLRRRSADLLSQVIDPRVRALITAIQAEMPDEDAWLAYVAMQVIGTPPEGWTDDDRRRFEIAAKDLGATFRRLEALHADVRAYGGEFEAIRISVNSTSGGDLVRLLQLDPADREVLDPIIDELLAKLAGSAARSEDVAERLLARLLERQLTMVVQDVDADAYGRDINPATEKESG